MKRQPWYMESLPAPRGKTQEQVAGMVVAHALKGKHRFINARRKRDGVIEVKVSLR
jgi:hypothetical protein